MEILCYFEFLYKKKEVLEFSKLFSYDIDFNIFDPENNKDWEEYMALVQESMESKSYESWVETQEQFPINQLKPTNYFRSICMYVQLIIYHLYLFFILIKCYFHILLKYIFINYSHKIQR